MRNARAVWRLTAVWAGLAVLTTGGCPFFLGGLFGGGNGNDPNAVDGDPNTGSDADPNDGPGGTPTNAAPVVDAGSDRTVLSGDAVTLTGTASDPDGDGLTLLWEQTGGAVVTLAGATSLSATFTAPGGAGTLTFRFSADDGNGHVVDDTVSVEVTVPEAFLFVANNDNGRITSYSTSAIDGEVPPTTALNPGAATSLFQVRSVLVTPGGMLFASRQNGGVVVYDDALAADDVTPADRVVDGNTTLLEAPIALAYDAASDTLYVGNANAEEGVLAFADATQNTFDGDVAPVRMFVPSDRFPVEGSIRMTIDALWLDDDGRLYASDTSGLNVNSSRILVWNDPASADGEAPADREITSASFGNIEDIVVDEMGRLFVVDGSNNIYVFDDAGALEDEVTPDATITLDGSPTPQLHGIAVDANGVGYVSDRENDALYSLEGIASLEGSVPVDTILEGFDTLIGGPRQMWIHQP